MSKALVASASPRPASRNARSSPASSTSSRWRKNEATATDRWSRWHEPRSRARVSSAADSRADARSLPPLSFRRAPGPRGPGAQGWCVSPRDLSIDDLSSKRHGGRPPTDALFPLPLFLLLSPSLRSRLQGDRREGAGAHQGGPLRRGRLPRRAGAPRARRGARAIRTPDPARLRSFCSSTLARVVTGSHTTAFAW